MQSAMTVVKGMICTFKANPQIYSSHTTRASQTVGPMVNRSCLVYINNVYGESENRGPSKHPCGILKYSFDGYDSSF